MHGSRKFVQLNILEDGKFMDRNGEFQLELALSNVQSLFEHQFKGQGSIFQSSGRLGKMETGYFSFGLYDWNLSIYPSGRAESQLGTGNEIVEVANGMVIYLNRQTGLDRTCRVRFNVRIGEGDNATESGVRDELSDADGRCFGWQPRVKFGDCLNHGTFTILVDFISISTISQVDLGVLPTTPIGVPVYDKDKFAWEVETDTNGDTLRIRLNHKDIKNIPRNHIRYVCWSAFLIKKHPKLVSKLGSMGIKDMSQASVGADYTARIPLDQKIYTQFYVQEEEDGGFLMDTGISLKEVEYGQLSSYENLFENFNP